MEKVDTAKFVKPWTDQFSEQMNVRLEKREKMSNEGRNPYKNNFKPNVTAVELIKRFGQMSKEEIGDTEEFEIAGRALLVRNFGKASFVQIDDGSSKFQLYVRKGTVAAEDFAEFKYIDYGDIVYAKGTVFKTNKGELSLKVTNFTILTKSIRPLPEKFHGLTDPELRYRMRYVDMVMNPEVRETLRKRSQIVRYIREFFYENDYLEVETPMMHAVAGGAAAKPFQTHHNALNMDLSMRIAPELHLKRLIVGGYPKVFEINRCFRNEGLSIKHNPEFTTIEFYEAYATYEDLMNFTEKLIAGIASEVLKTDKVTYQGNEICFNSPFVRMTFREAICRFSDITMDKIEDRNVLIDAIVAKTEYYKEDVEGLGHGKLLELCFEEFAENHLIQPTFITEYPTEISPLARRNDDKPEIVDRFEFFINGWEIANAFSELNNPTDQLERFAEQAMAKEAGDEEACEVDYDYVRALEYGMSPTGGEGIGIDRLCMILTGSDSIRDVILFPLLKKEVFITEQNKEVDK